MDDQQIPPQYMPIGKRTGDDFDKWRFESNEAVTDLEFNLRGLFFNPKTETWDQLGERLINEKGAKFIRTIVSPVVGKESKLTTFDIDEIYTQAKIFALTINRSIFRSHDDWEVPTPTHGNSILWALAFFVQNTLKQSEGALAVKSLMEMSQTSRHVVQQEKQGGGMFGLFGGKK